MMTEQGGREVSAPQRQDALRRWRATIAAQIAGFQALIDTHQEEVARGVLPPEELEWVAKEIRSWSRHLEALTMRIEQLNAE